MAEMMFMMAVFGALLLMVWSSSKCEKAHYTKGYLHGISGREPERDSSGRWHADLQEAYHQRKG